jgi:iron complex outermembrane recepter protein
MKLTLRSASSAAIIAGLAGALPVWAQEAPAPTPQVDQTAPQTAPAEQEDAERVVVTGSFIQGTPEDAALPVEVYTQEDLEEQGAPTALEFVKSLSIAGPTTGEAYYFGGAGNTGNVQFNIRGLGADKTLTLLNGRRIGENASLMPSAALARTEILKDGAAVIYGADATGGVVNFITRDDFTGLEAKAAYKYIDGSDGDYGFSLLGGIGEGDTNFIWSFEWDHRSQLESEEREVSSLPYHINPAPWSTLTNLAGWTARGALPPVPNNTTNGEFGAPLSAPLADFTQSSCGAVGGIFVNSFTCSYGYISYYDLVSVQDQYKVYAQLNTTISDNIDFHVEAAYGQTMVPNQTGSPAQPVIRGPARAQGATNQFYIPITNPHAAAFAARAGAPVGTQGFTPTTYRAFAHGGNPLWAADRGYQGTPTKIDNQSWRVSAALNGTLGEAFGAFSDVGFDVALTYNQGITYADAPDVIGFRLQQAMNGFGGPDCSVADLDPVRFGTQNPAQAGKGSCMWWNPFATSFPNQPELGLTNPQYVAGSENSLDLIRWIFDPRAGENVSSSLTLDAVFNSETPLALPGGNVGVAVGGQVRQIENREVSFGDLYNGNTPCEWPASEGQTPRNPTDPLFNGCTPDKPGPFVFFATDEPISTDQQQYSFFGEASIPVLDNLNFQAAVRREEFSGGLGATVYKVSGKWDVFGPISIRGAYGTNYQAPPAGLVPGEVNNGVNSYTKAGGDWRGAQTVTRDGIVPETATAWNVGVIWQSQGFAADHDLRIIVDYFDIETEDELGLLATANDIANLVFPGPANNNTSLADCSHPLIGRVTFNDSPTSPGGQCVQGQTTAANFSSIRTEFGNGPGQLVAGFDIQFDYTLPLGPGDLSIGATATNMTEFKFTPKSLDGFQLDSGDDRLGFLNFATIAGAAPEWRASGNINYRVDQHNFRLQTTYVSAVDDERGPLTPGGILGVNQFGPTTYGVIGKDWFVFDFHYNLDITETLRLSASVANLFDKGPPPAREEFGFDPLAGGNALGRTFEIGIKKTF